MQNSFLLLQAAPKPRSDLSVTFTCKAPRDQRLIKIKIKCEQIGGREETQLLQQIANSGRLVQRENFK
jgi:hypothetical protein